MNRPTILLATPVLYGIDDNIAKNFEDYNFNVLHIVVRMGYKLKKIKDKLIHRSNKTLFRNRQHKITLRFHDQVNEDEIFAFAETFDYALFIRPDLFPISFIKKLRPHVKELIAYQWDGLSRFPDIKNHLNLYDRFFAFDPKDITDNILSATNFYFDFFSNENIVEKKQVYFLGAYVKDRKPFIRSFIKHFETVNYNSKFLLFDPKNKLGYKNILIRNVGRISYQENLKNVRESSVLIDLQNFEHHGLSFRLFEGICYDKKIITTNPNVQFYDFYNKNNIFIWNEKNVNELQEFLQMPVIPYPEGIKQKYSFGNWHRYILNIDPHIPINLPKQWI